MKNLFHLILSMLAVPLHAEFTPQVFVTEYTLDEATQPIAGFGRSAICQELYDFFIRSFAKGSVMLEFGSGFGTGQLAKHFTMHSVEHNATWVNKYDSHYIHAPIYDGWFDVRILKDQLPATYDVILVDGPPAAIGRRGFLKNIHMFNTNVPIVFDDVQREADYLIMIDTAKELKRNCFVYTSEEKAWGVIYPDSTKLENAIAQNYITMPFDVSMQKDSDDYQAKYGGSDFNKGLLNRLRSLYQKNNLSKVAVQPTPKIPLIIHQIWVGPNPLPELYAELAQTWKDFHPDWTYILWTDKEVKQLNLYNQELYDQARAYSEKANILRLELLERYGGVYIDIDFECLKPLDILHHCYDFYTGIAPNKATTILANGMIGSIPGHPIFHDLIQTMHESLQSGGQEARNGVFYFSKKFYKYLIEDRSDTLDIAFPITYFYPFDKTYGQPILDADFIRPESFAIHYWGKTLEQKINLYNQKR